MTCEKCGEDTRVIYTKGECDCITRNRTCQKCGHKFRTVEIDEKIYESIIKAKCTAEK